MTNTTSPTQPGRHRLPAIGAALATVALLLAVGCHGGPGRDSAGGPAVVSAAAPSPVPSSTPGPSGPTRYRVVDDLCAVLDLSAVPTPFGAPDPNDRTPGTDKNSSLTVMSCKVGLGTDATALYSIFAGVVTTYSAAALFHGLRDRQTAPVSDLPGLGTAAYSYLDPTTGPHVVTYHANLHLSVGLARAPEAVAATPAGPDAIAMLVQVCRTVMTALREP